MHRGPQHGEFCRDSRHHVQPQEDFESPRVSPGVSHRLTSPWPVDAADFTDNAIAAAFFFACG